MGECHRMKCCLCAKVSRYERMLSTSGWLIISALLTSVSGKESRSFFLHEFGYTACSMAKIYEIDGAVVRTHVGPDTPYPSYPTTCDLQFETRTNRKRFMIRFDLLDINDCDDVLTVWNGYIAAQRVLATISCENKTSDVLYTSSSHLGLSFTTNSGGAEGKGFEAVITAFDDGVNDPKKCFYGDFHCDNGKCIDAKLNCDLINHCEDWSDERGNADCAHQAFATNDGLQTGTIIAIVVMSIAVLLGAISAYVCCCCRRPVTGVPAVRSSANQSRPAGNTSGNSRPNNYKHVKNNLGEQNVNATSKSPSSNKKQSTGKQPKLATTIDSPSGSVKVIIDQGQVYYPPES